MDATAITALRTAAGIGAVGAAARARRCPRGRDRRHRRAGARARRAVALVRDVGELRVGGRSAAKAEALARELRARGAARPRRGVDRGGGPRRRRRVRHHALARAGDPARMGRAGRPRHLGRLQPRGPRARRARPSPPRWSSSSRARPRSPPPPAGANDITRPIRDGLIGPEHVHAELGELVAGTRPGRTTPGPDHAVQVGRRRGPGRRRGRTRAAAGRAGRRGHPRRTQVALRPGRC